MNGKGSPKTQTTRVVPGDPIKKSTDNNLNNTYEIIGGLEEDRSSETKFHLSIH